MRLRKLLLAASAIVAAGAMALAPAAQASTPGGPIVRLEVGTAGGSGPHNITLTAKSAFLQFAVYGVTTTINCTAGSATGIANEGTTNPYMVIKTMTLNCPSIFPNTTATITAVCDINITYADNVHNGLLDTGANPAAKFHRTAGVARLTNGAGGHCVKVDISNGCSFLVGNVSNAGFDEAVKTGNVQDLYLSGNTPQIKSPNPACLGAVTNNQPFTLNAVFNVASPDGFLDFQNQ